MTEVEKSKRLREVTRSAEISFDSLSRLRMNSVVVLQRVVRSFSLVGEPLSYLLDR